jgi:hypothetical protein
MPIVRIDFAVGPGGVNRVEDVATIQELLNLAAAPGIGPVTVDGAIGPATIATIKAFQSRVVRLREATGRVLPNDQTLTALLRTADPAIQQLTQLPACTPVLGLTDANFTSVATTLGCETAAIRAVAEVEARGDGFFSSGRPKILFEAHQFSKRTAHKYDRLHPGISSPVWNKALYAGGEAEYDRLLRAMLLNRDAALASASWGRFQIMGFNHAAAGHATLAAFITAMFESDLAHLEAFAAFVKSSKLDDALKKKDWARFARGYNGAEYAANAYDTKLEAAYKKYAPPPAPARQPVPAGKPNPSPVKK